jgi:hypothetical protein
MGLHGNDVCGGSCVDAQRNYCTIPTVGNLRGGSFLFLPEPIGVKLLSCSLYVKSLVFWAVFIHKIKIVLVIQVQIPSYV